MKRAAFLCLTLFASAVISARDIPEGYWPPSRSQDVLDKTLRIHLAPDLSSLTAAERETLSSLYAAGAVMQELYEVSRHSQARSALAALQRLHEQQDRPQWSANLLELYRLSQGPIVTTLENERVPFLPVSPQVPGRNVYPADLTRAELDAFLEKHSGQRAALLDERTVVRRATRDNISADLQTLRSHPLIAGFHEDLAKQLESLLRSPDAKSFYAVPYAVAYAEQLLKARSHLLDAARSIAPEDAEFARYLRHRANDFITNDYEAGDASWVTGRFKRLNAQIGAYESYDDALYGVKAFHGMSILVLNESATDELVRALGGLQAIEDALPYQSDRRVREDIPVGVYQVVADFGQARGANTATILPNDPLFSRRYGRTILMRENIMRNEQLFAPSLRAWQAVVAKAHADDLKPEGNFQRTLWHEIGHYLGPDRDLQGRTVNVALEDYADAMEEMKSDLVSLFALHRLEHPSLKVIQASGIRRTLQEVKPRVDQPYQTMQLIQFNWFLEHGLLSPEPGPGRLQIHHERYPEVVTSLLSEVLKLQQQGDKAQVADFFRRWTGWTDVHEAIAKRMRDAQGPRFTLVRYRALGE